MQSGVSFDFKAAQYPKLLRLLRLKRCAREVFDEETMKNEAEGYNRSKKAVNDSEGKFKPSTDIPLSCTMHSLLTVFSGTKPFPLLYKINLAVSLKQPRLSPLLRPWISCWLNLFEFLCRSGASLSEIGGARLRFAFRTCLLCSN